MHKILACTLYTVHTFPHRMRVIEVRLFNRPKLSDNVIHGHKDLTVCRMGLFRVLMKLLIRNGDKPIYCKSPFFLPMLFAILKSLARDYSLLAQNKLPPDQCEELLLERIELMSQAVSPRVESAGDEGECSDDDKAGLSMLEDEDEEESDRRKSSDWYPIFRRSRHAAGSDNPQQADEEEEEPLPLLTSTPSKQQCADDDGGDALEEKEEPLPHLLTLTPGKQQCADDDCGGDAAAGEEAAASTVSDVDMETERGEESDMDVNDWNCSGNGSVTANDDSDDDVSLLSQCPSDPYIDPALTDLDWNNM